MQLAAYQIQLSPQQYFRAKTGTFEILIFMCYVKTGSFVTEQFFPPDCGKCIDVKLYLDTYILF